MLTTGEVIQTILWIVALGTGSVLLAVYIFQDKLLYFPSMPPDARTVFLSPTRFGLGQVLKEVFITTSHNLKIQVRHWAVLIQSCLGTMFVAWLKFDSNC